MYKELTTLASSLAKARDEVFARKSAEAKKKKALEALEAWKVYQGAIEARKVAKVAEELAYQSLCEKTLQVFDDTGAKAIMDGIAVRDTIVVEIPDKTKAEAWVRANMPALLVVDWGNFEALAKANNIVPDDVVVVKKEPKAYIARDLSAYLRDDVSAGAGVDNQPEPGASAA